MSIGVRCGWGCDGVDNGAGLWYILITNGKGIMSLIETARIESQTPEPGNLSVGIWAVSFVGVTMSKSYTEKLTDPRWKERRMEILVRDKGRCVACMSPHWLQVHHKEYIYGLEPWEYLDEYLVTLCRRCHEIVGGHYCLSTPEFMAQWKEDHSEKAYAL